jgi:hypothetical protein
MRSELTSGPGGRLMLGALAAACLTVSACGASAGDSPNQPNGQQTTSMSAATARFCSGVQTALASLAGKNPSDSMSLKAAKATLDGLLADGIRNFTKLEGSAPASLRSSVATIVGDLRTYETLANKSTTIKQLLDSSVRASPVQKSAYQELISYSSDNCQ